MKSFMKYFAFALIIPVVFVFTGCGAGGVLSSEATISKSKSYNQPVATSDFKAYVEGDALENIEAATTDLISYRLTLKVNVSMNTDDQVIKYKLSLNAIVGQDMQGKIQAIMKMGGMGLSSEIYIKDGMLFSKQKIKILGQSITSKYKTEFTDTDSLTSCIGGGISDIDSIMELLGECDQITVSSTTSNVETRYKIEIPSSALSGSIDTSSLGAGEITNDLLAYLNFSADKELIAAEINYKLNQELLENTSNFDFKVVLCQYDGLFEFPTDLDTYEYFDEILF